MRQTLLFFAFIFNVCGLIAQTKNQLDNLQAFAEVFGYVKYYHPSDAAYNTDWDAFAIYGSEKIKECKDVDEFIEVMNGLFKPIAPGFQISKSKERFNNQELIPSNSKTYKSAYWQHLGVSYGMVNRGRSPYQSIRVNADNKVDNASRIGNIIGSIDLKSYHGKTLKYTGWAKLNENDKGSGHLWFRVDQENGGTGFFDNMGNRPIKADSWKQYEIIAPIDSLAAKLVFGAFLDGKGTLSLDDLNLSYKSGDNWIEIPLKNGDFENEKITGKDSQ
jgi:hypothetical protein